MLSNWKWMDRAIILCLPALIVNLLLAIGWITQNGMGTTATVLVAIFAFILTGIVTVLLIRFMDLAFTFMGRGSKKGAPYRVAWWFAGIGTCLGCILLIALTITNLSNLGYFTGGDAFLMQVEIIAVAFMVWSRVHKRRLQRKRQQ